MPGSMSRSPTVAALAAAVFVLGGCGGDGAFRTDRPILRITLDEYRIVPQNIEIKPGRTKFVVRNAGRLTHNLVIQVPDGPDGKPLAIDRVATMQPGQTAEPIKVTLAPGEYRIVCTIANHDDLGQFGTLKVR
jgi:uncharacterized cupredoxin-like copper-binding protein